MIVQRLVNRRGLAIDREPQPGDFRNDVGLSVDQQTRIVSPRPTRVKVGRRGVTQGSNRTGGRQKLVRVIAQQHHDRDLGAVVVAPAAECPEVTASALRLTVSLGYWCAAKTWATAPRLKAVVLTGSMVCGMVKSRSPAPRMTG